MKKRFALMWVALVLSVVGVVSTIPQTTASGAEGKLNILLTNDDGFDAVGIQTMKEALKAYHNVMLVAPSTNRSGSSSAIMRDAVLFNEVNPKEYRAEATPVMCAAIGFHFLERKVDLVISGTNDGPNLGWDVVFSGTVGAARAATLLRNTSAIAFSTKAPSDDPSENRTHFEHVANFAVRLIARLQQEARPSDSLLPDGIFLNINYPPLAPDKVKGKKVISQKVVNAGSNLKFTEQNGVLVPRIVSPSCEPAQGPEPTQSPDQAAFCEGYISVNPMDGDETASLPVAQEIEQKLKNLKP